MVFVMRSVSLADKKFIYEESRKHHRCKCGCGQYIKIKRSHRYIGIPRFLRHHYKFTEKDFITFTCPECGKEIKDIPYKVKNLITCSVECRDKRNSRLQLSVRTGERKDRIEIECLNCHKMFYRVPHLAQKRFCSLKCAHEHIIGSNNPSWKGGKKLALERRSSKHRQRGSIFLNKSFVGCAGHHIDKDHIIHIPNKIHNPTFLPHSYYTWLNMDAQNRIAFDYLYNDLDNAIMNLEAIENLRLIYTVD